MVVNKEDDIKNIKTRKKTFYYIFLAIFYHKKTKFIVYKKLVSFLYLTFNFFFINC